MCLSVEEWKRNILFLSILPVLLPCTKFSGQKSKSAPVRMRGRQVSRRENIYPWLAPCSRVRSGAPGDAHADMDLSNLRKRANLSSISQRPAPLPNACIVVVPGRSRHQTPAQSVVGEEGEMPVNIPVRSPESLYRRGFSSCPTRQWAGVLYLLPRGIATICPTASPLQPTRSAS